MTRRNDPVPLKLVKGRGQTRDGRPTDQEGKPIPTPPDFRRTLPERPEWLSEDAVELWEMLVKDMGRIGMIKELDGFALRMGCEAYARWRAAVRHRQAQAAKDEQEAEAEGIPNAGGLLARTSQGWGVAPWIRVESDAAREFRQWCNEFGLTPAAEVALARMENNPKGAAGGSAYA